MNMNLALCSAATAKHKQRLHAMGYQVLDDVLSVEAQDLAVDLHIPVDEAYSMQKQIQTALPKLPKLQRLVDMKMEVVKTGVEYLDSALGGGLPIGKVVEVYGEPGVGKTQLCMQTCANTVVSSEETDALYVDTEGGFIGERMAQILYCHMEKSGDEQEESHRLSGYLSRIFYARICDNEEFSRMLSDELEPFLQRNPKIRLLVIDSIAMPFRFAFENWSERTFQLSRVSQRILHFTNTHGLAILQVNQVTTKFKPLSDISNNEESCNDFISADNSELVPCLGDSWSYASHILMQVSHLQEGMRKCRILKNINGGPKSFEFTITERGWRCET